MNFHIGMLAVDGMFAGDMDMKLLQRVDLIAHMEKTLWLLIVLNGMSIVDR